MAADGDPERLAGQGEGEDDLGEADVKVILLGDSAVGKSKLVERFLMDEYCPRQLSTYALTLFRKNTTLPDGEEVAVDFWDTAGQERFASMHPSYYFKAQACILVFDVTRKTTYQHLNEWYSELRQHCENIPCILVANKIDVDYKVTKKSFKFPRTHNLPFFFVSAADGTNVVQVFEQAIAAAVEYKRSGQGDFVAQVLELLDEDGFGGSEDADDATADAAADAKGGADDEDSEDELGLREDKLAGAKGAK